MKEAIAENKDWWDELTDQQIQGIQRGIKDIDEGKVVSYEVVKRKYGL